MEQAFRLSGLRYLPPIKCRAGVPDKKYVKWGAPPNIGPGMRVVLACVLWTLLITCLHSWRNGNSGRDAALRVGFLPITCHLICPVTWKHLESTDLSFRAVKFSSWPEMIEALRGGELDVAFILAPIAIALRQQGVPIKIVLLGHRDGTALVVRDDPAIRDMHDLSGRTVAIPIRFSTQHLALRRLCSEAGVPIDTLNLVELPPPDMPSAVAAGAIDAYIVGEPYAAQSELAGTGRVLRHMKDARPGFISSVVVVREEVLADRARISPLLTDFYRESRWIEQNRYEAARIAAPVYGLPISLLRYVLNTPPDRVSYADIIPCPEEFRSLGREMVEAGLLEEAPSGEQLVDVSWCEKESSDSQNRDFRGAPASNRDTNGHRAGRVE
jgi:NitT/TauT family transport system substrate-binding protein